MAKTPAAELLKNWVSIARSRRREAADNGVGELGGWQTNIGGLQCDRIGQNKKLPPLDQ
jgi:hypothetical protein